ncbi:MAG: NAD-dependent epimerase/dehydratase family protein [Bdellovibrionales bacterium]|nr:NAD-dependent epimerase/dehydratase family protein [Bdellovibrionales bacterium]
MKILVTGGSGFLGRQISEIAEREDYQVFSPRSTEMNLLNLEQATSYLDKVVESHGALDAIVHSAAYYGGIGIIEAEPATVFHRNSQMGLNVFELARRFKVRKVVAVGSACAYPGYLQGDLKEEKFWDGPLHASVEAYGFTKKLLLVAQHAYYKQFEIESNHLALTNLYGPHDVFTEYRSHVLSALIKKFTDSKDKVLLWGDGSPIREFLYVRDAAEAIVKAIALPHDPEPINIGTGVGTSIKTLAEMIARLTEFKGIIEWDTSKPNGAERKVLDIHRMREKLEWYPERDLEEGLRETIDWYIPNKEKADLRR